MAKTVRGFKVIVTTDENGVFAEAIAALMVGSTDDPKFSKIHSKVLSPSAQNIAILQAILDARFAELKQEEGIE